MGIALRKPENHFTGNLQIRCPEALPLAIEKAASKSLMTSSEYVRRSVIDRLKADGIDPACPELTATVAVAGGSHGTGD
jgi:hypothetical protein